MADEARNELFSARHPLLAKSVWLRTLQPRRLRLNYLKSPVMDISPRIGFPTDEALNRLAWDAPSARGNTARVRQGKRRRQVQKLG